LKGTVGQRFDPQLLLLFESRPCRWSTYRVSNPSPNRTRWTSKPVPAGS